MKEEEIKEYIEELESLFDLCDTSDAYESLQGVKKYIENLQSQLKAKEEVIKEAREYIEKNKYFYSGLQNEDLEIGLFETEINDLFKILSKGENK